MRSRVLLTPLVAADTLAATPIVASPFQPADAQAWGDKDRDGVPNAVICPGARKTRGAAAPRWWHEPLSGAEEQFVACHHCGMLHYLHIGKTAGSTIKQPRKTAATR